MDSIVSKVKCNVKWFLNLLTGLRLSKSLDRRILGRVPCRARKSPGGEVRSAERLRAGVVLVPPLHSLALFFTFMEGQAHDLQYSAAFLFDINM